MKKLVIMILCTPMLFLLSCGKEVPADEAAYQSITAEEAKNRMDENKDHILLDVRTLEEYEESRIEGAVLIPHDEIAQRAESELPDKDVEILIYCRSGRRSALAAKDLVDMGYTKVYDMGGINEWPYEIEESN